MHVNLHCLPVGRVYLIVFECESNSDRLLSYLLEMAVKAFGVRQQHYRQYESGNEYRSPSLQLYISILLSGWMEEV